MTVYRCLQSSDKQDCRAFQGQYLYANNSEAIASITFAIAFMMLATFMTFISMRFFIIVPMNSVSDVQEFIFLDFYTALILGGCIAVLTSITAIRQEVWYLGFTHRARIAQYFHPLAGMLLPTSGISDPAPYFNIKPKRASCPLISCSFASALNSLTLSFMHWVLFTWLNCGKDNQAACQCRNTGSLIGVEI